ncbi:MAG: alpha/beta fold hydrolase [Alphaproteobacteria bacterium]|nr:alpha/beta fold hydrolase [Alphaproteobacteria bacterium]
MSGAASLQPVLPHYLRDALRHDIVRRLVNEARRHETGHPGGRVVWHEWGSGPTIVLLHGGFGSWLHWVRNIEPLSARFRLLAADLPGLGESDAVLPSKPTAAEVAQPLVSGLAGLLPAEEPLRLVCFSLGAVIGGQVALALRARVERVMLLGPSGLGEMWRNVTTHLMRRRPDMSEEERRVTIRHNLLHSMIASEAAIDDLAMDLQSDLVRQKRQLIGLPLSLSDALTSAIPVLAPRLGIVWGEKDCYPTPDVATVARRLEESFPGLRTGIIPGAGHWVAYEAAEAVSAMLLETFSGKESIRE